MAVRLKNRATISGSAQSLSTLLSITSAFGQHYSQLTIKSDRANAGTVYVGGDSSTNSSNYCFALAQGCSYTFGPFSNMPVNSADIWIVGTASDKIEVVGVT